MANTTTWVITGTNKMKITKNQLRRIIKDEKAKLNEEFQGAMLDLDDYEALKDMILSTVRTWSSMTGYTEEDAIHALKSIIEEI